MQRPQSWNRYAYGRSNPLTLVDPDGNAELHFQVRTFIPAKSAPFLWESFAGDDRGFSTAKDASFRSRQEFSIETDPATSIEPLLREFSEFGTSQRAGFLSGEPYGETREGIGSLSVAAHRNAAGDTIVHVTTIAKNPFAYFGGRLGPSINNNLKISISQDGDTIIVEGSLDGFPATEIYVENEEGEVTPLLQFDPGSVGNGTASLINGVGTQWINRACTDITTSYLPSCG